MKSLFICSLYNPFLLKVSNSDFGYPIVISRTSNGACGDFFPIRNFGCQIRNQRPKRYTYGWRSHRIAEKNGEHNLAYRIMPVTGRTAAEVEANLRQTKRMTRKRHDRASEAMRTRKGQAREGHDRIMPKKDMTEIEKVGQVSTEQHICLSKLSR